MGAAVEVFVEFGVNLESDGATGTVYASKFESLHEDVLIDRGLSLSYGIRGQGALDLVAGSGNCDFELNNFAQADGRLAGRWSPDHANVTDGKTLSWVVGADIRVSFVRSSESALSVTGAVFSTVALPGNSYITFTTAATHSLAVGDYVRIAGASPDAVNTTWRVDVVPTTTTFRAYHTGSPGTITGTLTWRPAYVKHQGRLRKVDPGVGKQDQTVSVDSVDRMRSFTDANIRNVALLTDVREDEILDAVIAAMNVDVIPLWTDFDTGVDSYPYVFDDLGKGKKARSILKQTSINGFGITFMKGDGTLRFQNRQARGTASSQHTFTDSTMIGFSSPTDGEKSFGLVRSTMNPRRIDTSNVVLFAAEGVPLSVAAGDTLTVRVEWKNPNDDSRELIGATSTVTPASSTDYLGNDQDDGLGTDVTSDLSLVLTAYATGGLIAITNNGSGTAYLVDGSGDPKLQIRGKGAYNLAPVTFEVEGDDSWNSEKSLDIPLTYHSNAQLALDYATFVEGQYNSLSAQVQYIEFHANDSDTLLLAALQCEPGDIVTVSESNTGVASIEVVIQSVELNVSKGPWVECRFGVAPTAPFVPWVLGTSELGSTTLGF